MGRWGQLFNIVGQKEHLAYKKQWHLSQVFSSGRAEEENEGKLRKQQLKRRRKTYYLSCFETVGWVSNMTSGQ